MKNKHLYVIVNGLLLFITIILINVLPNSFDGLKYIGVWLIIESAIFLFRYKKNTNICLLIGIISIITICFSLSVCLNTYNTAYNWQINLIDRFQNIINAKNYMLFFTILFISIGVINENNNIELKEEYNPIISTFGILFLIYALIFGFDRGSVGIYSSNTNALYEYAIVVFLFVWNYSKNSKRTKKVLILYSILYCFQAIAYGDRSSCVPMLMLLFLILYKKKYTIKHVIVIGLCGIFFSNIVDVFRHSGTLLSLPLLREVVNRGLFVNTISYSFYGGTQIIRYGTSYPSLKIPHMMNYLVSTFIGGSSKYNLTLIANKSGFINKGGGMSHVYFYYWGGYFFTALFALVIGRIINYIFNKDENSANLLKITVTVFLIRWFVYYPVALFRTAILVPLVCNFMFSVFTNILRKKDILK